jgi:hypothetical protein
MESWMFLCFFSKVVFISLSASFKLAAAEIVNSDFSCFCAGATLPEHALKTISSENESNSVKRSFFIVSSRKTKVVKTYENYIGIFFLIKAKITARKKTCCRSRMN